MSKVAGAWIVYHDQCPSPLNPSPKKATLNDDVEQWRRLSRGNIYQRVHVPKPDQPNPYCVWCGAEIDSVQNVIESVGGEPRTICEMDAHEMRLVHFLAEAEASGWKASENLGGPF
jgi:hypothetical protein